MLTQMAGSHPGAGALVGQRLGRYDLLALLALGGTAEIYLARIDGMMGFEKYVVVKCLHDHLAEDEDFVSMFLDEARLGAQLDHSNIVQTLGLGEHDARYYMVMEYISGLSLALVGRRAHERVRGGKLPVAVVLNVAAQACAGLHYAHERALNLVHRDVSPQNLVITFEGIVKVVDFGIAKAEYRETRTRSGTVKGKFAYMSPEQCQAKDVDRRTDVFALGTIVWELLTGRRLFKRDSTYETYQAVVECRVPPPSSINHELDPAIDRLVMAALAKDPAQRYPTAEAFGEALSAYMHQRGKPSGPGEIARFFDDHFAQEIEDHAGRMRELIEGRKRSVADQQQLQWDSSELDGSASVLDSELLEELIEESVRAPSPARLAEAARDVGVAAAAPRAATVPARPKRETAPARARPASQPPATPPTAAPRATGPRPAVASPARDADAESFSGSVQDLSETHDLGADTHDDEIPSESTRIEANPTQLLADLDARSGRARTGEPAPRAVPEPGVASRAVPEPGAARRPTTASAGAGAAAPPRKGVGVVTPPGVRATGAPLDPLPHERDALLAVPAPPGGPAQRPAFGPAAATQLSDAGVAAIPTVLAAPEPGRRFSDMPTLHDTSQPPGGAAAAMAAAAAAPAGVAPRGFAAAPAQVPTVIAPGAPGSPGSDQRRRAATTPPPVGPAGRPATRPPTMPPPLASRAATQPGLAAPTAPPSAATLDAPLPGTASGPGDAAHAPSPGYPPGSPTAPVHAAGGYGQLDPAMLVSLPPVEQVFPGYQAAHAGYAHGAHAGYPDTTLRTHTPLKRYPPWVLGVVFFAVVALATGLTVALVRAFGA